MTKPTLSAICADITRLVEIAVEAGKANVPPWGIGPEVLEIEKRLTAAGLPLKDTTSLITRRIVAPNAFDAAMMQTLSRDPVKQVPAPGSLADTAVDVFISAECLRDAANALAHHISPTSASEMPQHMRLLRSLCIEIGDFTNAMAKLHKVAPKQNNGL